MFAKEDSFELTFDLSTVFLRTLVLIYRYRHLGKECTVIAKIKCVIVMRSTKFFLRCVVKYQVLLPVLIPVNTDEQFMYFCVGKYALIC